MLGFLGLQSLPPEIQWFAAFLGFSAVVSFGWGTDMVLRDIGFGPVGNALIGTTGAMLAPRLWFGSNGHGFFSIGDPAAVLACAGIGAAAFLSLAAACKKALARA